MSQYVMFIINSGVFASNCTARILEDYSWWIDLAKKSLKKADTFEMRLWPDDVEAIESGLKYGTKINNEETEEIVFQGKVNDFEIEVQENFTSREGYIKWFTLNLYHGKKLLFSSGHYGDETLVYDLSEEESHKIQEWAKNYPVIKRVDVYNEMNSTQF